MLIYADCLGHIKDTHHDLTILSSLVGGQSHALSPVCVVTSANCYFPEGGKKDGGSVFAKWNVPWLNEYLNSGENFITEWLCLFRVAKNNSLFSVFSHLRISQLFQFEISPKLMDCHGIMWGIHCPHRINPVNCGILLNCLQLVNVLTQHLLYW